MKTGDDAYGVKRCDIGTRIKSFVLSLNPKRICFIIEVYLFTGLCGYIENDNYQRYKGCKAKNGRKEKEMEGVYEVGMTDKQFSAYLRDQIIKWERVKEIAERDMEEEKKGQLIKEIDKNIEILREDLAS